MKKLIVAGIIALGACLADASKPTDNISLKNLAATLELSEEKLASFLQTEGVSATDVVAIVHSQSSPPKTFLTLNTGARIGISKVALEKKQSCIIL